MRIRFDPFTLDLESRQLTSGGQEVHLEPKAFELLSALVLERPKALVFYFGPIGKGPSLDAGLPRALFHANVWAFGNQVYAVARDGRFLVAVTPQRSSSAAPLTVVLNWTAAIHK